MEVLRLPFFFTLKILWKVRRLLYYPYHFSWRGKESHDHSRAPDSLECFADRNRQGLSSDK